MSEKYDSRDVVFFSLTADPESDLEEIRKFILATGLPWPTGYGAERVTKAIGAEFPPWTVVFGRDGRAVWNSAFESQEFDPAFAQLPKITVEQAIDLALATK